MGEYLSVPKRQKEEVEKGEANNVSVISLLIAPSKIDQARPNLLECVLQVRYVGMGM